MNPVVPVRKTFVEFVYPGLLFNEYGSQEVVVREINLKDVPTDVIAYRFFDLIEGTIEVDGNEQTLQGEPFNYSSLHYIGGRVMTKKEIRAELPKDNARRLIGNLGDAPKAIKTRYGNFQPFKKGDVHIPV